MLIYYNPVTTNISGCYKYSRDEAKNWRKFAAANKLLMNYFKTMPPTPGKGAVDRYKLTNLNKVG